jgi:hypothetical protein
MKRILVLLMALHLVMLASSALAGWEIVDSNGGRTFISDGWVKEAPEEGDGWMAMDFSRGMILIVNPESRIYAESSLDEFCEVMDFLTELSRDAMAKSEGDDRPGSKPKVKVEKGGQKTIAGLSSDQYKIYVDGAFHEEVWLTRDSNLIKELGTPENRRKAFACFSFDEVQSSPAYVDIISAGWVMESTDAEGEIDSDATQVRKKEFSDSEFKAPDGYEKTSVGKAMGMGTN